MAIKSTFRGQHLKKKNIEAFGVHHNVTSIDRWEAFHTEDLDREFEVGDLVLINGKKIKIEYKIFDLDNKGIIYDTDKVLSKE